MRVVRSITTEALALAAFGVLAAIVAGAVGLH